GLTDTISETISVTDVGGTGTVTDIDGNTYQTIIIGDQEWMMENLKVSHYQDGTSIPTGYSSSQWANLNSDAYAIYSDNESIAVDYGYLYNWYAVENNQGIAPEGWHIPTDDEWKILEAYLGMSTAEADQTGFRGTDEGGQLKEIGFNHWNDPNTGATNESNFSALPGGFRRGNDDGNYIYLGNRGYFWSLTEDGAQYSWVRILFNNSSEVYRSSDFKQTGLSVRCIKD
ncbi:fibrobacter succinogenes major paralogous domain-containing protein, partial [bacterium]|nr:fibrobacter succinogenes major paralogous domain-containing protein [bacterium]